jgi:hypothetical protein
MNIDLDINNYNYDDLLQLFKIQEKQKDNRQIIQEKLLLIQPKVNPDIYNFYKKSSQILDCIYTLFDSNMLLDLNDQKMISHYIDKIKKIENYEKKNTQNIFQELISLNDEKDFDLGNSNSMNSMFSNLQQNQNFIIDSYSNQVAPGKLNSLKRITQTQNICLNSCFRSQYLQSASTDFDYLIPTEIKNVVSMRLASIEIPNSWYLFSDKKINNTFKIIIDNNCINDNNSIKTEHIICIPEGNYDIDTIEEFLNTVYFYKSNTDLNFIKFSINPLNYKSSFEIINCDNPLLSFSLTFIEDINQNPMNTCGWIFGFRSPKYININEKVTSEGLFDAGGDRYLYLSLTDYQYNNNNINIIGFDKSILENDILAKVLLVNGKFSLIINENTNSLTKIRKYNGPINLKKIHVKLLDKFGELIDLNQMDFSFTLELELLYESFNFKNVYG